ncbi:MAG: hypothetical protein QM402_03975, partial [Synergistota bacterium]|nr:hypothetical protein [Synergistota bacterium]
HACTKTPCRSTRLYISIAGYIPYTNMLHALSRKVKKVIATIATGMAVGPMSGEYLRFRLFLHGLLMYEI